MIPTFKIYKNVLFSIILMVSGIICTYAQNATSSIKAQVALGLNNPSRDGFVSGFEGQTYNFPTVNLGVQYMFSRTLGAKLDYGFSRISNQKFAQDFKLNYSRVNLQLVYDASQIFNFLPSRFGTFAHVGPGFSMIKPLGNFTQNDTSFLNAMAGIEFHYGISDKLTLYLDTAYILGFSDGFSPISEGFGSFNGNLLTLTVGASISLSGCYYCENE
ncbi:outer membrane beta-barrel protein [Changchengzhania lutea]|uniref:outer membrane beta-barrel protein n=1 Tax=Changchengzhania lutea TaxID=2049305 RepID=UPI00163D4A41|nr:outer membrane beta-barrel protein [Changchengzhania lutea]